MLELYNIGSGYKQVRIVIVLTFPNTRKNVFAPNVEWCIKVWDFRSPNCVQFNSCTTFLLSDSEHENDLAYR